MDGRLPGRLRSETRAQQQQQQQQRAAAPPVPAEGANPSPPQQAAINTPLPRASSQSDEENLGLLARMGTDTLRSILEARELVEGGGDSMAAFGGGARSGGGERKEGDGGPGGRAGAPPWGGHGGVPIGLAVRLARTEEIESALDDEQPPEERPEIPQCFATDFRVPKTYRDAMRSDYAHLWQDAVQREFFGILKSGVIVAPG